MSPRVAVSLLHLQTDGRLARLAAAGDHAAFAALVARHRAALERHCERIVPAERARDAVQQAFINAHRALVRGDRVEDVGAWLHRIAHNAALEILRERAWGDEPLAAAAEPAVESSEAIVERRERLTAMIDALAELPERQREALVLQALEGCSHEQIALRLGTSGGAVRQLLARGRSALRAGCTAVLPFGLVLRWGTGSARAAVGGAGASASGGAVVVKGLAIAGMAAGMAGGVTVAVAPHGHRHPAPRTEARAPATVAARPAPWARTAAAAPAKARTASATTLRSSRAATDLPRHVAAPRTAAAPHASRPAGATAPAATAAPAPATSAPASPAPSAPRQPAGDGGTQSAAPQTPAPAAAPAPPHEDAPGATDAQEAAAPQPAGEAETEPTATTPDSADDSVTGDTPDGTP